jgi:hypothetical protein
MRVCFEVQSESMKDVLTAVQAYLNRASGAPTRLALNPFSPLLPTSQAQKMKPSRRHTRI